MNKKLILSIIALLCVSSTFSQIQRKLWRGIEEAEGAAFNNETSFFEYRQMYMNSLRAVVGYYVLPNLSLGASIGLAYYGCYGGINTAPLCLDVRYHPLATDQHWVLIGDIGRSIMDDDYSYATGKIQADIAVGYEFKLSKKFKLMPSFGYNYSQYKDSDENFDLHTLFVRVGFAFK